jgi:glucose/arabinose dehydrogenase
MQHTINYTFAIICVIISACNGNRTASTQGKDTIPTAHTDSAIILPKPYATKSSVKFSKVVGWPQGKAPIAPEGFKVTKFAEDLRNPRWIYIGPNGDIFVSEASTERKGLKKVKDELTGKSNSQSQEGSANRITLFRDTDKDGIPELREVFLADLNMPFGMLVHGSYFYVANTDGLWRYPYQTGQTKITAKGEKILKLTEGGYNHHWVRNLIASKDGTKIYVSVGSASNVGEYGMENEIRRACILEINPDGTGEKTYASGLRNPVGMDWNPISGELWTAVNERDMLGDDLVPDYITSVREGGFYGWPYAYFGPNDDPSFKGDKRPDLVQKTIVPDVPLGAHTASLGLAFYDQKVFPAKYHNGVFVGQHGSWNRSELSGYKVLFVPFKSGKPSGKHEDFLSGFVSDMDKGEVYGRPVCVRVLRDGALLVTDDAANTLWHVSISK